ncbi:MAG TPA: hypothetical protein VF867_16770, partial [Arthrobacter sp.]
MGCISPLLRRPAGGPRISTVGGSAAVVAVLAMMVSCSAGPAGTGRPSAISAPVTATSAGVPSAGPAAAPVTAEISQLRDNYSRQIIAIQLTNTTSGPVTVHGAGLASPFFAGTIDWQATPGGIELPPGQPKILPAQLPAPECGLQTGPAGEGPALVLRFAEGPGPGSTATVHATDPYGVLSRNNSEMCLAQAATAVAGIRLEPE